MTTCRTCELIEERTRPETPLWDSILRTPRWDVVHAYGSSLPGWLCLIVLRHITSVADMTTEEAAELGPLVRDLSAAVQEAVGCDKTYVVQFAEHPDHPHVHFHVIPRPAGLDDARKGPGVFSYLGAGPDQVVPEAKRDEIALKVRSALEARSISATRAPRSVQRHPVDEFSELLREFDDYPPDVVPVPELLPESHG